MGNENGLFADNATLYVSSPNLSTIQAILQDLSKTENWTKEHGMVAHQDKTKYMITGTQQKISRCEDCSLSLSLNNKLLQKTEHEKLLGIYIDPNLS